MNEQELTQYLNNSIERLMSSVIKKTISNPKETAFLLSQIHNQHQQAKLRQKQEEEGKHVPAFLIASITQRCNLHCAGCYSRGRGMCLDSPAQEQLPAKTWNRVLSEAETLGISFCILAGGEPLLRKDVLEVAADHKKTIFPVFTSGTIFQEELFTLFDTARNLIPILSLEGNESETNLRRGEGTYQKLTNFMQELNRRKILFGVSITCTSDNYQRILSNAFLEIIEKYGAKVVFLIAYSATTKDTKYLELSPNQIKSMQNMVSSARNNHPNLWFLSFPGDEEFMGGCLAAGRGFFHISPTGSAEPCPFSPYSDRNIKDVPLDEAITSPLFQRLNLSKLVGGDHDGGCALIEHEEKVKMLLSSK